MEFENENINDRQLNTRAQLEELSRSDYEIVDGEPDITGWNVLSQSGDKLGEVEDLLFDSPGTQSTLPYCSIAGERGRHPG
jgi:hypothetical protein